MNKNIQELKEQILKLEKELELKDEKIISLLENKQEQTIKEINEKIIYMKYQVIKQVEILKEVPVERQKLIIIQSKGQFPQKISQLERLIHALKIQNQLLKKQKQQLQKEFSKKSHMFEQLENDAMKQQEESFLIQQRIKEQNIELKKEIQQLKKQIIEKSERIGQYQISQKSFNEEEKRLKNMRNKLFQYSREEEQILYNISKEIDFKMKQKISIQIMTELKGTDQLIYDQNTGQLFMIGKRYLDQLKKQKNHVDYANAITNTIQQNIFVIQHIQFKAETNQISITTELQEKQQDLKLFKKKGIIENLNQNIYLDITQQNKNQSKYNQKLQIIEGLIKQKYQPKYKQIMSQSQKLKKIKQDTIKKQDQQTKEKKDIRKKKKFQIQHCISITQERIFKINTEIMTDLSFQLQKYLAQTINKHYSDAQTMYNINQCYKENSFQQIKQKLESIDQQVNDYQEEIKRKYQSCQKQKNNNQRQNNNLQNDNQNTTQQKKQVYQKQDQQKFKKQLQKKYQKQNENQQPKNQNKLEYKIQNKDQQQKVDLKQDQLKIQQNKQIKIQGKQICFQINLYDKEKQKIDMGKGNQQQFQNTKNVQKQQKLIIIQIYDTNKQKEQKQKLIRIKDQKQLIKQEQNPQKNVIKSQSKNQYHQLTQSQQIINKIQYDQFIKTNQLKELVQKEVMVQTDLHISNRSSIKEILQSRNSVDQTNIQKLFQKINIEIQSNIIPQNIIQQIYKLKKTISECNQRQNQLLKQNQLLFWKFENIRQQIKNMSRDQFDKQDSLLYQKIKKKEHTLQYLKTKLFQPENFSLQDDMNKAWNLFYSIYSELTGYANKYNKIIPKIIQKAYQQTQFGNMIYYFITLHPLKKQIIAQLKQQTKEQFQSLQTKDSKKNQFSENIIQCFDFNNTKDAINKIMMEQSNNKNKIQKIKKLFSMEDIQQNDNKLKLNQYHEIKELKNSNTQLKQLHDKEQRKLRKIKSEVQLKETFFNIQQIQILKKQNQELKNRHKEIQQRLNKKYKQIVDKQIEDNEFKFQSQVSQNSISSLQQHIRLLKQQLRKKSEIIYHLNFFVKEGPINVRKKQNYLDEVEKLTDQLMNSRRQLQKCSQLNRRKDKKIQKLQKKIKDLQNKQQKSISLIESNKSNIEQLQQTIQKLKQELSQKKFMLMQINEDPHNDSKIQYIMQLQNTIKNLEQENGIMSQRNYYLQKILIERQYGNQKNFTQNQNIILQLKNKVQFLNQNQNQSIEFSMNKYPPYAYYHILKQKMLLIKKLQTQLHQQKNFQFKNKFSQYVKGLQQSFKQSTQQLKIQQSIINTYNQTFKKLLEILNQLENENKKEQLISLIGTIQNKTTIEINKLIGPQMQKLSEIFVKMYQKIKQHQNELQSQMSSIFQILNQFKCQYQQSQRFNFNKQKLEFK